MEDVKRIDVAQERGQCCCGPANVPWVPQEAEDLDRLSVSLSRRTDMYMK